MSHNGIKLAVAQFETVGVSGAKFGLALNAVLVGESCRFGDETRTSVDTGDSTGKAWAASDRPGCNPGAAAKIEKGSGSPLRAVALVPRGR